MMAKFHPDNDQLWRFSFEMLAARKRATHAADGQVIAATVERMSCCWPRLVIPSLAHKENDSYPGPGNGRGLVLLKPDLPSTQGTHDLFVWNAPRGLRWFCILWCNWGRFVKRKDLQQRVHDDNFNKILVWEPPGDWNLGSIPFFRFGFWRARDHGYRSSREPQRRATQRMCHVMLPSCHVALLEERAGKKKKEQQLNEQFLRCFVYWPV